MLRAQRAPAFTDFDELGFPPPKLSVPGNGHGQGTLEIKVRPRETAGATGKGNQLCWSSRIDPCSSL